MKVVTAGYKYMDIDAYGGIVAYTELLHKQGHQAKAVCTAPMNESITPSLRAIKVEFARSYTQNPKDTFIVIDVSEPEYIETFVRHDRVEAVIDHHVGYEDYWQQRIGKKANLEFVGAACTQVYEEWQKAGLLDQMSSESAKLLAAGILDNTLNFGAEITTERDKKAYDELVKIGNLNPYFAIQYFGECQEAIVADLPGAIKNDYKILQFPGLKVNVHVGQLVLWDADEVLASSSDVIEQALGDMSDTWFMNLICLKAGKSYFMARDEAVRTWLQAVLGVEFKGQLAKADRLWLRKDTVKQAAKSHAYVLYPYK